MSNKFAMVEDALRRGVREVFDSTEEEERYQAFKKRLVSELVARARSPHTAMWIEQELHDSTAREDW